VRRLLNSGFQVVLTHRLTSDNIERGQRLFNSMRQSNGGNFNMTKAAASALQKRLKTGIVIASEACNVGLSREERRNYLLITQKNILKKSANDVLRNLPSEMTELLAKLQKPSG
jgi:hypothetical protein